MNNDEKTLNDTIFKSSPNVTMIGMVSKKHVHTSKIIAKL